MPPDVSVIRSQMADPRGQRSQWHLDEMVVRIGGEPMYLWRAADHEREILDMLVQRERDKRAPLKLMRKLLKRQGFVPTVLIQLRLDELRGGPGVTRPCTLTVHRYAEGVLGSPLQSRCSSQTTLLKDDCRILNLI